MKRFLTKPAWIVVLVVLLLLLQHQLWFQSSGILKMWQLDHQLSESENRNAELRKKNEALAREVDALKKDPRQVENEAREDLGMVKKGEKFYRIYNKQGQQSDKN